MKEYNIRNSMDKAFEDLLNLHKQYHSNDTNGLINKDSLNRAIIETIKVRFPQFTQKFIKLNEEDFKKYVTSNQKYLKEHTDCKADAMEFFEQNVPKDFKFVFDRKTNYTDSISVIRKVAMNIDDLIWYFDLESTVFNKADAKNKALELINNGFAIQFMTLRGRKILRDYMVENHTMDFIWGTSEAYKSEKRNLITVDVNVVIPMSKLNTDTVDYVVNLFNNLPEIR